MPVPANPSDERCLPRWVSTLTVAATPLLTLLGCAPSTTKANSLPPLEVVEQVELERYLGTWYEIASYPQSFQKGCTATTATYELRDDGKITVINRCRRGGLDAEVDESRGLARVVDDSTNAKLKVSFFRPFWGDYWIIDLGEDYEYAVVGHPGRDYLWILAREPTIDPEQYNVITERLEGVHDYDTSRLRKTLQPDPQ